MATRSSRVPWGSISTSRAAGSTSPTRTAVSWSSSSTSALIAALLLAAGCGDDGGAPDASPPDAWTGSGVYDDPGDFPREGCAPGGFGDGDVENIYHLAPDVTISAWSLVTVRVDDADTRIAGYRGGTFAASDDDVIVQVESEAAGHFEAVDLCARDADGTVRGHYVICNATCAVGTVEGRAVLPLDEPPATGLTLLGEYGPWPADFFGTGVTVNVRVRDGVAYLARYHDGLRILDVSDPANITELGHVPTAAPPVVETWNDVKIADGPGGTRYALLASDLRGIVVVDVTDPTAPAIVRSIRSAPPKPGSPTDAHTLFIDGTRLYFTNANYGLEIWDVADPAQPTFLGIHDTGVEGYLHDLYVEGDRAYLAIYYHGMQVVDVSDPANTVLLGTFEHADTHSLWVTDAGGRRIAIHGGEGYDAHVRILDVTEGSVDFGNVLGEWRTRPEVSVHNVMAQANLAIVAHYHDGVRVLDASDPTQPTEIAHFQTWNGLEGEYGSVFYEGVYGIDLDQATGIIYAAESHRGLLVLQLDP